MTGLVAALSPMASASAFPTATVAKRTDAAASAKQRIDAMRARAGARPLRRSASLDRSAQAYARMMLRGHFFGHSARIRASRRFRLLGETLAMHRGRARARTVVRLWRHSPGHYSALVSRRFRQIGIGAATGRFHGRRVTMWVVHLGRR